MTVGRSFDGFQNRPLQCIRAGHGYYTFLVDSYVDFLYKIAPGFCNSDYEFAWRGMDDPQWELTSSLSRSIKSMRTTKSSFNLTGTLVILRHIEKFLYQLRGLGFLSSEHHELYTLIQKYIARPPDTFLTVIEELPNQYRLLIYELFSIGQHHGLLTPFLDWTSVPAISLFFAFEELGSKQPDVGWRVVYAINKTVVEKVCKPSESGNKDALVFLESMAQNNTRVIGQAGLFTFCATNMTVDQWVVKNIKPDVACPVLLRFFIRNEDRLGCLRTLNKLNINRRSLFPDSSGASLHSNYLFLEQIEAINTSYKPSLL